MMRKSRLIPNTHESTTYAWCLEHSLQEGYTITWTRLGTFFLCKLKKIKGDKHYGYYGIGRLSQLKLMDFEK